jgi:hypothetical protein
MIIAATVMITCIAEVFFQGQIVDLNNEVLFSYAIVNAGS